jgi:dienelactone hydrolase
MTLRPIDYQADGVRLTGYLADGSRGGSAPGILVAHESLGITAHVKARALALAEQGFVAFALDLFGRHDLDLDEARRQTSPFVTTPGLLYARANAALEALANQANVDAARPDAAGADWELHVFGGVGHSYTNPAVDAYGMPGFAYNAQADRRSWQMALELLGEQLDHHTAV